MNKIKNYFFKLYEKIKCKFYVRTPKGEMFLYYVEAITEGKNPPVISAYEDILDKIISKFPELNRKQSAEVAVGILKNMKPGKDIYDY